MSAPALQLADLELVDVRNALADGAGLVLTDTALAEVTGPLVHDLRRWGTDTEVTGQLLAALSRRLLSRPWPTYGDQLSDDELDALHAALRQRAEDLGWLARTFLVTGASGRTFAWSMTREAAEQSLDLWQQRRPAEVLSIVETAGRTALS